MTDEERRFLKDLSKLLIKHDVSIIAEHEQIDYDWDETKISFISNNGSTIDVEATDCVDGLGLLGILETD